MNLFDDIVAFQKMEISRRKWVLNQFFDLRRIVEHDFADQPQKINDFTIGLHAIDALHHIAKGEGLRSCAFCGKSPKEVKVMIAGPTAHICDECARLSYDIVSAGNSLTDKVELDPKDKEGDS